MKYLIIFGLSLINIMVAGSHANAAKSKVQVPYTNKIGYIEVQIDDQTGNYTFDWQKLINPRLEVTTSLAQQLDCKEYAKLIKGGNLPKDFYRTEKKSVTLQLFEMPDRDLLKKKVKSLFPALKYVTDVTGFYLKENNQATVELSFANNALTLEDKKILVPAAEYSFIDNLTKSSTRSELANKGSATLYFIHKPLLCDLTNKSVSIDIVVIFTEQQVTERPLGVTALQIFKANIEVIKNQHLLEKAGPNLFGLGDNISNRAAALLAFGLAQSQVSTNVFLYNQFDYIYREIFVNGANRPKQLSIIDAGKLHEQIRIETREITEEDVLLTKNLQIEVVQ